MKTVDITLGNDNTLIDDFEKFYNRTGKIKGVVLFKSSLADHSTSFYYISLPAVFPFDPLRIFSHYNIRKSYEPRADMLKTIIGDSS